MKQKQFLNTNMMKYTKQQIQVLRISSQTNSKEKPTDIIHRKGAQNKRQTEDLKIYPKVNTFKASIRLTASQLFNRNNGGQETTIIALKYQKETNS